MSAALAAPATHNMNNIIIGITYTYNRHIPMIITDAIDCVCYSKNVINSKKYKKTVKIACFYGKQSLSYNYNLKVIRKTIT